MLLGSIPRVSDSGGLGKAQEFAFLTGFQEMLIILAGYCALRPTTSVTMMVNFVC